MAMMVCAGKALAMGLLLLCSSVRATEADRVKVIQFAMAKCPMTTTWTAAFDEQVMHDDEMRSVIDFEQSYVGGDVGEGPVNDTNWMRCFHGPSECEGHTIMLCARNVSLPDVSAPDYRWFDMVRCMDGERGLAGVTYGMNYSIPQDGEACARKSGLNWDKIQQCAAGEVGQQLLHEGRDRDVDH